MSTPGTPRPAGLGRLLRAITKKGLALAVQAAGAVTVVVAVGVLAGVAWAVLAGGTVLLVAGALAES